MSHNVMAVPHMLSLPQPWPGRSERERAAAAAHDVNPNFETRAVLPSVAAMPLLPPRHLPP